MTESLIEVLKTAIAQMTDIQGCTEQELIDLMQDQQVACLPDTYRQVMRLMGKQGLETLLNGKAHYDRVKGFKADFAESPEIKQLGFPPDSFIFFEDYQGCGYFFFRTRGCESDPAVYFNWESRYYNKLTSSFSELILIYASGSNWEEKLNAKWEEAQRLQLLYDANADGFYPAPYQYDQVLSTEELIRQIAAEEDDPIGCSEAEIAEIMRIQNVTYIPKPYRRLLLELGKPGPFQGGRIRNLANYYALQELKQDFMQVLNANEVTYPTDIFVIWGQKGSGGRHVYYFFRTVNCEDIVPVYEVVAWQSSQMRLVRFFKRANSLKEFIMHLRDPNSTRQVKQREEQYKQRYFYSEEEKDFVPAT